MFLLCTEIAVQKDFALRNMTSGGISGVAQKFSTLAIACHILQLPHKLRCNLTTARDPLVSWGGVFPLFCTPECSDVSICNNKW